MIDKKQIVDDVKERFKGWVDDIMTDPKFNDEMTKLSVNYLNPGYDIGTDDGFGDLNIDSKDLFEYTTWSTAILTTKILQKLRDEVDGWQLDKGER